MICALCGGTTNRQQVDEEVRSGNKHILVMVIAYVCSQCGERYFPEGVVDRLIEIKESADKNQLPIEEVGKVYRATA